MRASVALCVAYAMAVAAFASVLGPPKKPFKDRPDDKPRSHTETVRECPHGYAIELRGTVDGTMTRMPVGYGAYRQGWQPNRSVLIENVGPSDVRNPCIIVNGKRKWRTLQEVAAEATRGHTSAADKARAIWEAHRRRRFHACTWDAECSDAVKVLNVYGYTLCGNEAQLMNDLWKAAGLLLYFYL